MKNPLLLKCYSLYFMYLCIFAGKRRNHWQTIGSSSLEIVRDIFYVLNTWDWMSKENRENTLIPKWNMLECFNVLRHPEFSYKGGFLCQSHNLV